MASGPASWGAHYMSTRLAILGFCLIFVGLVAWGLHSLDHSLASIFAPGEVTCQRTTLTVVPSPDGQWIARSYRRHCFGQGIAATWLDLVVEIAPVGGAQRSEDVFAKSDYAAEPAPDLRWLSDNRLEIVMEPNSLIGLWRCQVQDVAVTLRFSPSDPTIRQAFLAERGLQEESCS